MSTENILLIANSNMLELNGLHNAVTNTFVNSATVVATLQDSQGVDVVGETWPVTLSYVSGTNGCYRVLLDPSIVLTDGDRYRLQLTAQGDGLTAQWDDYIRAKIRS